MLDKTTELPRSALDDRSPATPVKAPISLSALWARRREYRRVLLVAGPLLVAVVAGYFYFTSGRYISTDNAYVQSDKITVNPEVSGPISAVNVIENTHVDAGQLLFRIDPAPYQLTLARADAQVNTTITQIEALKASYQQQLSQTALAQSSLSFAERELQRQLPLARSAVVSQQALDQAQFNVDQARDKLALAERNAEQIKAQLGGDPNIPTANHPQVLAATAQRNSAALDLARTEVKAAFEGIASHVPKLGQYVSTGTPAMSLVAEKRLWIEANYKETEITGMKPGQSADITVDTYPGVTWHGHVESIAQATGSEFSILPPQNATGNWVKVVQRVPVRIAIDQDDDKPQLRTGMSTTVTVDMKAQSSNGAPIGAPPAGTTPRVSQSDPRSKSAP